MDERIGERRNPSDRRSRVNGWKFIGGSRKGHERRDGWDRRRRVAGLHTEEN